ncbi:MAG: hypothetical protein C7B43_02930 [Sulfobacillus benefaciens]|uniref:Uncharacterized protein n=1 Tax=Sulfobacillus benefaciens TaxID=453960 RepID=A0A2T2XA65_9FIRM|nr:MAG: hypothetical protein C7B43_02930 [Sulfobacillus benefaciens]
MRKTTAGADSRASRRRFDAFLPSHERKDKRKTGRAIRLAPRQPAKSPTISVLHMIINPRKKVARTTSMAIKERIIDDQHGIPLREADKPSGCRVTEGKEEAAVDSRILEKGLHRTLLEA